MQHSPGVGGVSHPAPPQADGVHALGQADLTVRRDGIEAVEPAGLGRVFFIDADQHRGRLLPGGGSGGGKLGSGNAVGQADVIGHGDIALVALHIGEGKRIAGGLLRHGLVAQGADQDHRHVLAADGSIGAEAPPFVQGTVLDGGGNGPFRPVAPGVRKAGGGRCLRVPAQHPGSHGDELGAGDRLAQAEGLARHAGHEAVGLGRLNGGRCPVAVGHVSVTPRRQCRTGGGQQD